MPEISKKGITITRSVPGVETNVVFSEDELKGIIVAHLLETGGLKLTRTPDWNKVTVFQIGGDASGAPRQFILRITEEKTDVA